MVIMREAVRRESVGSIVRGFIWLRDLRALTAERRFRELGLDMLSSVFLVCQAK